MADINFKKTHKRTEKEEHFRESLSKKILSVRTLSPISGIYQSSIGYSVVITLNIVDSNTIPTTANITIINPKNVTLATGKLQIPDNYSWRWENDECDWETIISTDNTEFYNLTIDDMRSVYNIMDTLADNYTQYRRH